jgi:hypothetical protein
MQPALEILVKSGTPAEQRMRRLLSRLVEEYDLTGWLFTTIVLLDETAMPHSHPVLTLNVAHERNAIMTLAEFVHEQLHWFEEQHAEDRDRAIEETRRWYPAVPSEHPEGAGNETSTRLHLLVCYLEYQALKCLVGGRAARRTIVALSQHHYRWIYRTVLSDEETIGRIICQYNLVPGPLRRRES